MKINKMKISVSSYSFSQLLKSGEYNQLTVIPLAAELGFEGIEFTDLEPPQGISENEFAVLIKEEAKRVGIEIVSYTVGANLLAEDSEAEIKRLFGKVDTAEILGAKLLRHDAYFGFPQNAPKGADFEYYLKKTADGFRRVTEYAEKKEIKTCTENHGLICQAPERVKAIIEAVNHKNFGWLLDIGNFLCVDYDPLKAVKIGAEYAFHVHAKDFNLREGKRGIEAIMGARIGKGVVPVKDCLEVIFKSGYNGFVCVEYEGSEPTVSALKESIEFLKEMKF